MNRTISQSNTQSLPRLQSQKKMLRVVTTQNRQRKTTEEETISTHNNQTSTAGRTASERKTLKSANSSKAVKYEATSAIFQKKIQALEKQNYLLDKQIIAIRQQIGELRVKSKNEGNDQVVSIATSQASSKLSSRWEEKLVKNKKVLLSRIDVLRKKIDKENEKNRKIEKQIDGVRRQIITTKKLNEEIGGELIEVTDQFNKETKLSIQLDEQIGSKNELLHRKKTESVHNKMHLIKSYDTILKKLDKQLQAKGKEEKGQFYLTDIYAQDKIQQFNLVQNSPKSKKTSIQINYLKQKLQQFEDQLIELKQKTNSENIEQMTKKFTEEYENNFRRYGFINNIYNQLQELKNKNEELLARKIKVKEEIQLKRKSRSFGQVEKINSKIEKIIEAKQQIKTQMNKQQLKFGKLKQFVIRFVQKIPLRELFNKYNITSETNFDDIITPENLLEFLQEILHIKENLTNQKQKPIANSNNHTQSMHQSVKSSASHNQLEDYLDNARKDGEKDRLLTREQLVKSKQSLNKKKPIPKTKNHK